MKNICSVLLFAIMFVCSGCLELTEVISLRKDGGMTVTMTYSLPAAQVPVMATGQKTISQWRQSQSKGVDEVAANWFMDEKAVRAFFTNPENGVSVRFYKQFLRDGRHFAEVVVDAKDARKAAELGYFGPMVISGKSLTLYLEETLENFKAADVERMRRLCGSMSMSVEVIVPGTIAKTTGYKRSASHAVWRYSADGRGIDIFKKLDDISVSWQ